MTNTEIKFNILLFKFKLQNLRSTLLLPFHSVSSAYLPPSMGTLTGMFNAWVWSFDFDLRDMSNEV